MGEAVIKYRVHYVESERGWGQKYFHSDFDTREQAQREYDVTNARNTSITAPDYYVQAERITVVDDELEGKYQR